MTSLLFSSNRLTLIKFNERWNQIMPSRHTIIQSTDKMTCISKFGEIGKEIHRQIAIVRPSKRRPNRNKCGPAPSRFLNLFKSDGLLPFPVTIVSLFSLSLLLGCPTAQLRAARPRANRICTSQISIFHGCPLFPESEIQSTLKRDAYSVTA